MNIWFEIVITILLTILVAVVLYRFYTFFLTPVRCGKGTGIFLVLRFDEHSEDVEQTIQGILWLNKSGVLKSRILIADCGMRQDGREIADAIAGENSGILICDPGELETILGDVQ